MRQQVSTLFWYMGLLFLMTQFLAGCDVQHADPYTSHMLIDSDAAPLGWRKVSNGRAGRWGPTGRYMQFGLPDKDKAWAFINEAIYSYNSPEQALKVFETARDAHFFQGSSFIPEGVEFFAQADQMAFECEYDKFDSYSTMNCSIVILYDHIMVEIGTNAIHDEWLTLQDFLNFVEKADQEVLKYRPQE